MKTPPIPLICAIPSSKKVGPSLGKMEPCKVAVLDDTLSIHQHLLSDTTTLALSSLLTKTLGKVSIRLNTSETPPIIFFQSIFQSIFQFYSVRSCTHLIKLKIYISFYLKTFFRILLFPLCDWGGCQEAISLWTWRRTGRVKTASTEAWTVWRVEIAGLTTVWKYFMTV